MKLYSSSVAAIFVLLLVACYSSFAQTSTGSINGHVTDSSGAMVPESPVSLVNAATGARQQTKASASGIFHFDLLNPGTYQVTATPEGFRETSVVVMVQLGQTAVADIKLDGQFR